MKEKIHLKKHSYTFARVSVMKAKLLKEEDYQKILKMGLNEVINFIQERVCKDEIGEFAGGKINADNIENMLNKHIENVFNKMRRISKNELLFIINEYLKRYDVEDMKTILRGKHTKLSDDKISSLLTAAGTLSREELQQCIEQEDLKGVLKEAAHFGVEGTTYKEKLADIEDNMERQYYKQMFLLTEKIAKSQFIKQFLERELEVKDLISILRLKQAGMNDQALDFPVGEKFKRKLNKLMQREIMEGASTMKDTVYAPLLQKGLEDYEKTKSLSRLETVLQQWLLRQTTQLAKGRLASVEYLLGYLFAKEIEARNLRIIVRGKQVDAEQEFIESQLVIRHG